MPETLAVDLNRDRLHAIEAPDSFATADSFLVEIENHGEAAHAHLRLDDALAEIASLPSGNHYIRTGTVARVPVSVHDAGPVQGTLVVATAYGSETHEIVIALEPTAGKQTVEIDDSLVQDSNQRTATTRSPGTTSTNTPSTVSASRSTGSRGSSAARSSDLDTPGLLAGTAIVVLFGIGMLFLDGILMLVGALAVLVGLVAAGYLLLY